MRIKNILYNVNHIIVDEGLEVSYKEFSYHLNEYLIREYENYYLGLQLYEDDSDPTNFYVVAFYNNICGLYCIINEIQEDISNIYDYKWGNSVERESVFSFTTSTRIIPPLCQ